MTLLREQPLSSPGVAASVRGALVPMRVPKQDVSLGTRCLGCLGANSSGQGIGVEAV